MSTKQDLQERAGSLGVDYPKSATKAELVDLILAAHPDDELALAERDDTLPAGDDAGQAGDDAGQAEAQHRADVETEQGYSGEKVDPFPNEAYSQESDPTTSPGVLESRVALDTLAGGGTDRQAVNAAEQAAEEGAARQNPDE